jgi:hypothetical protein
LSEAELVELGLRPREAKEGEMFWTGNLSLDQARQLNGPMGEQAWNSTVNMRWEKNIAKDSAWQVNGPLSAEAAKTFFA